MAKQRITAALVEAMAPGKVVFDSEVRGFMVRHRGGVPRYALKTRINEPVEKSRFQPNGSGVILTAKAAG